MKLFAIALLAVAAYGQAPKPETKEHKYLKAYIEGAKDRFMKKMEGTKSQDDLTRLLDELQRIQERGVKQLEMVDACTVVFHRTIDKRASDLTVREAALIKGCEDLDLYPLDMTKK